jgi:predicted PurR-regulated permease PerM
MTEKTTEGAPPLSGLRAPLVIVASILTIWALREAQSLVVPLLLALFAAVIAAPGVALLRRWGVPTGLAVILVVVLALMVLLVLGALVGSSVSDFSANLPAYTERLAGKVQAIETWVETRMGKNLDDLGAAFDPGKALHFARGFLTSVSGVLTNTLLILFTMILILLEFAGFPEKVRAALPDPKPTLEYFRRVGESLKRYMALKTGVSLITGVAAAVWVGVLGVDFALLWGLLAFLLNYVPTIGSILAAIPPVLMAFILFGFGKALLVAAGYVAINLVIGNLVEPKIMGKGLGLSTLVVFLSLLFWGWVLGTIGMLLSVPLTMVVKIALESHPDTRWAAVLLGPGVSEPEAPPPEEEAG